MEPLKKPLVLDKSFIQGSNAAQLDELAGEYTFYIPSAFYFELFNNQPDARSRTISGLKYFHRIDVYTSLKEEREQGKPVNSINSNIKVFNPLVRDKQWRVREQESRVLANYNNKIVNPLVDIFIALINNKITLGFSSEELAALSGSEKDFSTLCGELIKKERIQRIAEMASIQHASFIDSSWLHFCLVQAWALQVLILKKYYPDPRQCLGRKRMKHEILDMEYLILGLHCGSLATKETSQKKPFLSMAWKFKTLSENGVLFT